MKQCDEMELKGSHFTMIWKSLLVCASLLASSFALHELPERARGGRAWKSHVAKQLRAGDSSELFWNAQVDNFNSADNRTYAQRYYVNDQYWNGQGPVFLSIGGEGTLTGPPGGYIAQLGAQYGALLVSLEHRFYGVSIPNDDMSTENLKYLTVDQALADLANFIDYYTVAGKTGDSKWFAFGGSYPGALSSWFRASYPEHTVGSLSSSGVVNCIINFPEFDMQVSAAVGNACADQIRRINGAFERKIATENGWDYVTSLMHCEKDMWTEDFYYMIADSWSMADQYSSKSELCSAILAVGEDASDEQLMETFAAFSFDYWGEDFCTAGFYNTPQLSDPARWDINSRSWRWQTCYEVSYFNTAPVTGSLRSTTVNLDYHLRQCAAIFGTPMFPSSVKMNQKFGGAFPTATNVFYSDFSDDPWARASVTYPPSSDQPYKMAMCDDCGHCLDLHTPQESDPEPIKQTRAEFETYLKKWLA